MKLVCPAGNLPALKTAVDHGADAVYIGFKDATNARHFAGLNFSDKDVDAGIRYAGRHGVKIFLAINTYPQPATWSRWRAAVDRAVDLGIKTLIVADIGVMEYAAKHHPGLKLHLSVQGSATTPDAINFYHQYFGIRRAVLPRVLSLSQVEQLATRCQVPLEVFGFGSLCVMVEGRCLLSSYATGRSPNTYGACSPGNFVRWQETPEGLEARLNGVLIDRYADGENAGYPTLCKGRYQVNHDTFYALEEPVSLNTIALLPQLQSMGIAAIKLEGRQRSPAYVAKITSIWRQAIDACTQAPETYQPQASWMQQLQQVSEGAQTTLGAYHRPWQ